MKDDALVRGLHELAHARFALAQRPLGPPLPGDFVDEHEGADLFARMRKMRNEVHLDGAGFTARHHLLAHVAHGLPGLYPHDVRLDVPPGFLADHLAHGQAENGVHREAIGFGVTTIGEPAFQVEGIVGHHRRHGIGDQSQQRVCVVVGDGKRRASV